MQYGFLYNTGMKQRFIRIVCLRVMCIIPLCCALFFMGVLGISFAGRYFRVADQVCHFTGHIFWGSVLLVVIAGCIRKYRKGTLLLLVPVLIITGLETLPWYIPLKQDEQEISAFRVCLVNVLRRNTRYTAVQNFVADIDPDVMVLMETDSGWRNARKGFGICGTYLAPMALVIGIPIDHVLFSDHFRCAQFKKGPYIGSDHLPIWADIKMFQ